MRSVFNFVLYSFVAIIAGMSAIGHLGGTSIETCKRGKVELVYDTEIPRGEAEQIAETLSGPALFGARDNPISVRVDAEGDIRKLWVGYDLPSEGADEIGSYFEFFASAVSDLGCHGKTVEVALCETYDEPLLTVRSRPMLKNAVPSGRDIVFFSDAIEDSERDSFVRKLNDVGLLIDQGGFIYLDREGDGRFILHVSCTKEDARNKDPNTIQSDLIVLRDNVFMGAALKWVSCVDIDEPIEALTFQVDALEGHLQ